MARSKSMAGPTELTIRSYQVGFGDCFLLSFKYPDSSTVPRHVLIDFGSTGKPSGAPTLLEVAKQIENDCGGHLTALIATHRHADHINGFATNKKETASGDFIRRLQPKLVLQPWTEEPQINTDAVSPSERSGHGKAFSRMQLVAGLWAMHRVAEAVTSEAKRMQSYISAAAYAQLEFLGRENLHNASAVDNLIEMGRQGRAEYLSYGKKTRLETLLPGVKVRVLGPPTPADYPDIVKQRSSDANEFWQLMGASASHLVAPAVDPFPRAKCYAGHTHPLEARWLVSRLRAVHCAQRLSLVRVLDDAMNNTSLILLFEVGGKRFLFPGDAQIENWNYALKDADEFVANRKLLKKTDFYKVGHHGSRNATPKTLWGLFVKRSIKKSSGRLRTAVSTMGGKHGAIGAKTEVPRRSLIKALELESEFVTTQTLKKKGVYANVIKFTLP